MSRIHSDETITSATDQAICPRESESVLRRETQRIPAESKGMLSAANASIPTSKYKSGIHFRQY